MTAGIRDHNLFAALPRDNLITYLRGNRWDMLSERPGYYSLWKQRGDQRKQPLTVLVPAATDFVDYPQRMYEAVHNLAVAEERSQLDVLTDIEHVNTDVLHIAVQHTELEDGTLPLDYGAHILQHTHDLLHAAARHVAQPQPYLIGDDPAHVASYLRTLRLGQSERGSYVLNVLSPLPTNTPPPIYERQVVQRLLDGIAAAADAARASTPDDLTPFAHAVEHGASANLCSALSDMLRPADDGWQADNVMFGVTWAPALHDDPATVVVPADLAPMLAHGSNYLASHAAPVATVGERVTLRGLVQRLARTDAQHGGSVVLRARVDDGLHDVTMQLATADYRTALAAHLHNRPLVCSGDLIAHADGLHLHNVSRVAMV